MKPILMGSIFLAFAPTLLMSANATAEQIEKQVELQFTVFFTRGGNARCPIEREKLSAISFPDFANKTGKGWLQQSSVWSPEGFVPDGWIHIQPFITLTHVRIANKSVSLEFKVDVLTRIKGRGGRLDEFASATTSTINIADRKTETIRGPTLPDGNQIWVDLIARIEQ